MGIEALFALVLAAGQAEAPDYSIAYIRFDIPERAKIGSKRAGLLCFPNGALRWGDVARRGDESLIASASAALAASGLSLADPPSEIFENRAPPSRFRITGVVTELSASLCAPGWGLGQREAYKGSGRLRIVWSVHEQATRSLVRTETVDQTFEIGDVDGGSFGRALERAVSGSAAVLADRLSAAVPAN